METRYVEGSPTDRRTATGDCLASTIHACARRIAEPRDNDSAVFWERVISGSQNGIVEARDGRWVGVEVKLGAQRVDEGAANFLSLPEEARRGSSGEPREERGVGARMQGT